MIYLDHNATTPVLPEAVEAMIPWLTKNWGNPSSIHGPGRLARQAVDEARIKLARLIGTLPEQIIFTSGATEANNAAVHSALLRDPAKRHIVTSVVEHSSVLAFCDHLEENNGVEVTRLPVDFNGRLSVNDLRASIRSDTALVSLMWANNETGVIWPIKDFADICAAKSIPLHTDAVQAVGKLPLHFNDCGASYLSVSGHKFGAPKGVGALVVAEPEAFKSLLHGGKQEYGNRGGTENVPGIVALGVAAELVQVRNGPLWSRVARLRESLEGKLCELLKTARINGIGSNRLANTSNLYLPGMDGDALVTFLDQRGYCVSSGSACLESAIAPSHVIYSMSGSYDRASESIRVSLGIDCCLAEVDGFLDALKEFSEFNP